MILYIVPLCHTCTCTHVMQLSGMPAFVHPWINGMTEVVQFAAVSSISDILPTCAHTHTHTHTQFHANRLTGTYYTHTCTHTYIYNYIFTQSHSHSHSRIVYRTLLVISPFPCTMGSWASAVTGNGELSYIVQCLVAVLWYRRCCFGRKDYFGRWQCECVHFDVWWYLHHMCRLWYGRMPRPLHNTWSGTVQFVLCQGLGLK